MPILIVLNDPKDWSFKIPDVEVTSARTYLTDTHYSVLRNTKVFNLARSYRYQASGYYVSLLAEARGHRPLPSVQTIQDLKSTALLHMTSEDLYDLIQSSLSALQSSEFELSIYFGQNLAKRYAKLSRELFNRYPAPVLRARFTYKNKAWGLRAIHALPTGDIPAAHHEFVVQSALAYFARRRPLNRKKEQYRYDLAILHNPEEKSPPSDARAIKHFTQAAQSLGFSVELLTHEDSGRIAEFDALFIRETTEVNHHTFRLASKAQALGLLVMDDPESILRCTNKVYLYELLKRHKVALPKTCVMYKGNVDEVYQKLGLPCVLKQPDSAFSQGVVKAESEEEFYRYTDQLLKKSDLIVAQEFSPTEFDWRVGIVNRRPLYVCKYFMAKKHWQIVDYKKSGYAAEGESETIPVAEAPKQLINTALRAANLIGNGFYGVDIKEINGKFRVIEVNDNPSVDSGVEDAVLGADLYKAIMQVFLDRLDARTGRSQ